MKRLIIASAAMLSGCSPQVSTEATGADTAMHMRFDLNCRGTRYVRSEATPYEQVIHVDLEAGRYCTGECRSAYPISSQHPGLIVLRDRPSDGYNLIDKAAWFPDTGQYLAEFAATYRAYYESRTIAVCTRSELTTPVPTGPAHIGPDDPVPTPEDGLHASQPASEKR
ncbi:MAG: hypothetical protein IR159_09930 [Brevundimonas sp.]|nr:hypothetical protein [Brevundimonas sp.]